MLDQFRGCLLALACGESLAAEGAGATGTSPRRPGPALPAATAQMLCVLESYVESRSFDPHDVGERLAEWYRTTPAGVGPMTRAACEKLIFGYNFERASHEAWLSLPSTQRQDSECLARGAPAALLRYFDNIHLVGESRVLCSITHYDELCRFSCAVQNIAVAHLMLIGVDGLLDELLEFAGPRSEEVAAALAAIPGLRPSELPAGNFVLDALQCAIWAGLYCESVKEGLGILAGRPGMTAASCSAGGALLGSRLGIGSIPQPWLDALPVQERIDSGARKLFALAMAE